MDAFLTDLFDQPGVDVKPFLDPLTGGISHARLLADPRLIRNAAFRFVSQRLAGGPLPSGRCFAEYAKHTENDVQTCQPDLEHILTWLLMTCGGSFCILRDTELIRARVTLLRDGIFREYIKSLADITSGTLHRALVEKMMDRHAVLNKDTDSQLQTKLKQSLLSTHMQLVGGAERACEQDLIGNPISGMLASHEEVADETGLCTGHMIGRNDALKRRLSRDLHFTKRQYSKPWVTASLELMDRAEVVRMAIGSPWAVEESVALRCEHHVPVIFGTCVRLHTWIDGMGLSNLRPPCTSCLPLPTMPTSMLIVFGASELVTDAEIAEQGLAAGFMRIFRVGVARTHVETCMSGDKDRKPPLVYTLFFGAQGTSDWTYGLAASTLRRHLSSPCPYETNAVVNSHLLVDRCIIRMALTRGVLGGTRSRHPVGKIEDSEHVILAIDSRQDPSATMLSITIALSSLSDPSTWAVRMMCSRANRATCERMLGEVCTSFSICDASPELNVPPEAFNVETSYNNLMKSVTTWRALLPARNVLTVQDDGLLLRHGLESLDGGRVLKEESRTAYLGAMWADAPYNKHLKALVPSLVGNGGLSLRKVREMIRVCEALPASELRRLFHSRAEPIPEDVMFASRSASSMEAGAVRQLAQAFCCEMVRSTNALGFHKPWPYWACSETHAHMESLLAHESELHLRPSVCGEAG